MRLTGGQNIPSILHKQYTTVAGVERDIRGLWYIQARQAFSLPLQRGFQIKGLGFHDYDSHATKKQSAQRRLFAAAVDCFNQLLPTGGVNWNVVGQMSRDTWFDAAYNVGEWYFNYFMRESLDEIVNYRAPDWWWRYKNCCVDILENAPETEGANQKYNTAIDSASGNKQYIIFKKPVGMNYLYFHKKWCAYTDGVARGIDIIISKIVVSLDIDLVNWNHFHAMAENPLLEIKRWTIQSDANVNHYSPQWYKIDAPDCQAIAIHIAGEETSPSLLIHFNGNNGDTNYTAESGQELTFAGTAHIHTDAPKFGSGYLYLPTNESYFTLPANTNLQLGNTFTLELQLKTSSTRNGYLYNQQTDGGQYGAPQVRFFYYNNKLDFSNLWYVMIDGIWYSAYSVAFTCDYTPTGGWDHIRLVRNGSNWYIFVNGVSKALTLYKGGYSATLNQGDSIYYIGPYIVGGSSGTMRIDEYMITTEVLSTADFDPPTEEYSAGAGDPSLAIDGAGYDCDVSQSPFWTDSGKIAIGQLVDRNLA